MRKNIPKFIHWVYGVIFVFIFLIITLIWRNFIVSVDKSERIVHANEVLTSSEKVLSILKDIETGQRGYLLTKDSSFLIPHLNGLMLISSQLSNLENLISDNRVQVENVRKLADFSAKRIAIAQSTIKREAIYHFTNENIIAELNKGKLAMDSLRMLIISIQKIETTLLNERNEAYRYTIRFSIFTIVLLAFSVGGLTIFSFVYIKKQVKKDAKKSLKIFELNNELNHTIEELDAANEEIYTNNEELTSGNEELAAANDKLATTNIELQIANELINKMNSELEFRLLSIVNHTSDLICYSGADRVLKYINKAGKKMLGIDEEFDITTISTQGFQTQNNWQITQNAVKTAVECGFWEGESSVLSQNNQLIPIWLQLISHKNDKGELEFISTIARDISQIKNVQNELQEVANRYQMLFDNNPQPMWLYDVDTYKILEVNTAATLKYHYSKNELEQLTIQDLRQNEDIEKLELLVKSLRSGYYKAGEGLHKDKFGNTFHVNVSSFGFILNSRNVRLVLADDISDIKLAEQNLKKINEELIFRNEQLDKYVYVISHNIRGPVATLIGLIDLLEHETDNGKITMIVNNMGKTTQKLDEVIIDLNKVLSAKNIVKDAKENVNLKLLMEDVCQILSHEIKQVHANTILDFNGVNQLYTIKSYLHSVFFNLLSNAIKYRNENVPLEIKISSVAKNDGIEIYFSDNGLGIDLATNREKIFGLYKRFHIHVEGKGLGLHLSKSQIEALGGTIAVESEVNKGTSFIIFIPQ